MNYQKVFANSQVWLGLILLVGLGVRLYQLSPALLELVPNRQLIDATIVKAAYERGWANLKLHLYGFPLYHWLVVLIYKMMGGVVEEGGRLLSVGFSMGAAWLFYKLLCLIGNRRQALIGLAFFYLLSPVHIIMSRSFLIDELTLFLGIASLYYLALSYKRGKLVWFWVGTVMMTLTLLSKFTFGYLLLPGLWWVDKRKKWVFLWLTLVPAGLWYGYVKYLNEQLIGGQATGEYQLLYVFNPSNLVSVNFYINIFYHFATYAVTPFWLPLVFLGLVIKDKRRLAMPFYLWLIGAVGFIFSFNIASIITNYYFLALVAPAAFFAAVAVEKLYGLIKLSLRLSNLFVGLGLLVLGLTSVVTDEFLKAYRTYPLYQRIPKVGQLVEKLTRPEDKIVTSANRTSAILYFADREGWELRLGPLTSTQAIIQLEEFRVKGAKYYVLYDKSELADKAELAKHLEGYLVVFASPELKTVIYSL